MKFWRTPTPVQRYYVDLDFGQCHVRDNGARSKATLPVFCVHPMPLSGRSFTQFLKALSPVRYGVAPDLPGYGLSDPLPQKCSLSDYGAMLLDLAASIGLTEFALVAVSSSAMIAAEMARLDPDRVASLSLIDPDSSAPRLESSLQVSGEHLQDYWVRLTNAFGQDRPLSLKQRDLAEALKSLPFDDSVLTAIGGNELRSTLAALSQDVHVIRTACCLKELSGRDGTPLPDRNDHEAPDLEPGFLDLQAGRLAEIVNGILATSFAQPLPDVSLPGRLPQGGLVRRRYLRVREGQLHYRICEPVEPCFVPLTCFHASPQSGVIFENLLAAMGTDRIALAPDTPGFGDSDGPLQPPEIEDYARSMADFLDGLGIVETDLLGFHTGSMTAVELARQRPDLVRRIVLVSAPVFTEDELAAFRAHYQPMRYVEDGSHNVAAWQSFWEWRGPAQSIENYARNNALTLRGGPNKHWGHRAAFNYLLGETLGDVDRPILVLNPGDDLRQQTLRAEPLLQNGSILDIAPLSHGMFDDSTQEIAATLKAFLDSD